VAKKDGLKNSSVGRGLLFVVASLILALFLVIPHFSLGFLIDRGIVLVVLGPFLIAGLWVAWLLMRKFREQSKEQDYANHKRVTVTRGKKK
jgi:hypothetical protein